MIAMGIRAIATDLFDTLAPITSPCPPAFSISAAPVASIEVKVLQKTKNYSALSTLSPHTKYMMSEYTIGKTTKFGISADNFPKK